MKIKPVDVIVGGMALSITITIILIALMPYVLHSELTSDKAKMVTGVIGSVISIISMYVGAQIRDQHRSHDGRVTDKKALDK